MAHAQKPDTQKRRVWAPTPPPPVNSPSSQDGEHAEPKEPELAEPKIVVKLTKEEKKALKEESERRAANIHDRMMRNGAFSYKERTSLHRRVQQSEEHRKRLILEEKRKKEEAAANAAAFERHVRELPIPQPGNDAWD